MRLLLSTFLNLPQTDNAAKPAAFQTLELPAAHSATQHCSPAYSALHCFLGFTVLSRPAHMCALHVAMKALALSQVHHGKAAGPHPMLTPSCFWNACATRSTGAQWRNSKSTNGVPADSSTAHRYTECTAAKVSTVKRGGALPSHFDPPWRVQAPKKPSWAAALPPLPKPPCSTQLPAISSASSALCTLIPRHCQCCPAALRLAPFSFFFFFYLCGQGLGLSPCRSLGEIPRLCAVGSFGFD